MWPRADIVCVLGFEGEKIYRATKDLNVKYVFNEFYNESGSFRSLMLGYRACSNKNIVVIHGDILFNKKNLKFDLNNSTVLVNKGTSEDVGVLLNNKQVMNFSYGFEYTWQKIIYLENKTGAILKDIELHDDDFNKLDFELYNRLIDNSTCFDVYNTKTIEINTIKDYKLL